ncbi:MAG: M14 family metallopeptidase [candidate division Zixibacteria bacterium]|nr:M14 family metallopeptidase [candidate division Zixibacteria bacterium]
MRFLTAKIAILLLVAPGAAPADDWSTVAEQTMYQKTSSYQQTLDYLKRLEAASPWVRVTTFGKSAQGRDLHCVIVSREGAFAPADAKRTGKVIVLIQNGIHPGEIDGKDASLALLRDVAITKKRVALLDSVILLVIPIFNVDGHENTIRNTRANQDGPTNAGFRVTAQILNLNRDYLKADAPEMRAWLRLWRDWLPDFFVDDHVTDGGDWQYTIHYTMPWHPNAAPTIRAWTTRYFDADVTAAVEKAGFKIFPYATPRGADPRRGVITFVDIPRFSTGYTALWNRPGLLVEMHMLKDYRTRVLGNYAFLAAVLDNLNRNASSLKVAIAMADAQTLAGLNEPYPLTFDSDGDSVMVDFAGYATDSAKGVASGAFHPVFDRHKPVTQHVPYFGTFKAKVSIVPPRAYFIPREWTEILARLRLHGIRLDTLTAPFTTKAQMYHLDSAGWAREPFEGHLAVTYRTTAQDTSITFPAGTVVIDLHQPAAKVAMQALEPQGPDAFVAWGLWNAIFERKEYIEDYVIDPLADSMMAADGSLRAAFKARLATDTAFAKNTTARREYFYERSRFAEAQIGWYPVARFFGGMPAVDRWEGD